MRPMHPTHAQCTRSGSSRRRWRTARALATSLVLVLAASACGDGPTAPAVVDGTATVSASGAASASGSGLALFQSVTSGDASLFQIVVAPISQTGAVWQLQIVNYDGRLEEGTYQLSALSAGSDDPTANFYFSSGGSMQMYNATDGELVITSSSPSAVRGTFTFTAANTNGSGSVTVEGAFAAKCAPGTTCS